MPPCRRAASTSRRAGAKNHGITSMKPISDIWPSVILPAAFDHAELVQERVGERVIELQRDADQKRAEHEHRERRARAASSARRDRARRPAWRGGRPAAACAAARARTGPARSDAPAATRIGTRRRLEAERADHEAGDDPADRAEHADGRKLAARVAHLPERDGVAERQRRHEAERVGEQRRRRRTRTRCCVDAKNSSTAPATCSAHSSRSVAKKRSATMPTKNGEMIAASAVVPEARPICSPEKPSVCPSHVPSVTDQAPQTKYWQEHQGRQRGPGARPSCERALRVVEAGLHFVDRARPSPRYSYST